jgi:hypothetical protein
MLIKYDVTTNWVMSFLIWVWFSRSGFDWPMLRLRQFLIYVSFGGFPSPFYFGFWMVWLLYGCLYRASGFRVLIQKWLFSLLSLWNQVVGLWLCHRVGGLTHCHSWSLFLIWTVGAQALFMLVVVCRKLLIRGSICIGVRFIRLL